MGIQNFPTALQPIIQQGMLAREFMDGLQSRITFRAIAEREMFPNRIGETVTKTRKGLKNPVTTPLAPSTSNQLRQRPDPFDLVGGAVYAWHQTSMATRST